MKKFWNWKNVKAVNGETSEETVERTLYLDGTIAEESWYDDEISPALFKADLENGSGDITVWINSPGGDCFAAAQIYNMLRDYKGKVTVKIDAVAASAASVIAMAGDVVQISPVGMLMIHNPSTMSWGDHKEMQRAIEMLNECKESIINAYELKTGLPVNRLSKMMDEETWIGAKRAIELGFADKMIGGNENVAENSVMFSQKTVNNALMNKLCAEEKHGRRVDELSARLDMVKKYF